MAQARRPSQSTGLAPFFSKAQRPTGLLCGTRGPRAGLRLARVCEIRPPTGTRWSVAGWHKRGDPVSQRAFWPFFHGHSGQPGCWVGLEGHAPTSDAPRFARSDPRQAGRGAALSARTQRGAQERKPSPNPPENCTHAPDLVDSTERARSRRASSHWAGARRADRRRETVHRGASHQRVYYRSSIWKTSKNGRQLPSPLNRRFLCSRI